MRVALVALVLAGCGLADEPGGSRPAPPPAEARFVEPVCPATSVPGLDEPGTAIPDGFEVVFVLRCGVDDSGTHAVTDRVDAAAPGVTELMAELRRPSDRLTNGVCQSILIVPPYLLLVDATGRAVQPALPTDLCGLPRESAMDAVAALDFREESRAPLTR